MPDKGDLAVASDECEDDGTEERRADDYLLLDSRFEEEIGLDARNENHGWLFGTPLCPLPCYDLVIEDSLQEFHASLQSLKPEERLRSIKNRISSFKVNSDIPPIGYHNLLLLSVVEAIGAPQTVKDQGFFLAQQVEFLNWILRPSWEDNVPEKRQRKQHKTSVTNDKEILLDDGKGGLVHPSRACANYCKRSWSFHEMERITVHKET